MHPPGQAEAVNLQLPAPKIVGDGGGQVEGQDAKDLIYKSLPMYLVNEFTKSYLAFIHRQAADYLRVIDATDNRMLPLVKAATALEEAVERVCPTATKDVKIAGCPEPENHCGRRTTVDDFARLYNWLIDLGLLQKTVRMKTYRKVSNEYVVSMFNLDEVFLNETYPRSVEVTLNMMKEARQEPKLHRGIVIVGYDDIRKVFQTVCHSSLMGLKPY